MGVSAAVCRHRLRERVWCVRSALANQSLAKLARSQRASYNNSPGWVRRNSCDVNEREKDRHKAPVKRARQAFAYSLLTARCAVRRAADVEEADGRREFAGKDQVAAEVRYGIFAESAGGPLPGLLPPVSRHRVHTAPPWLLGSREMTDDPQSRAIPLITTRRNGFASSMHE